MSVAEAMIGSHPQATAVNDAIVACIRACIDCEQACVAYAHACMGEQDPTMLIRCIHLELDRADLCGVTGRVVSQQTASEVQLLRVGLEACAEACRLCADECEQDARYGMKHCRTCANACRACSQACHALLEQLAA